MERLARAVIPGLPHPVVPQGNRRSAIFFEDGDPETYLDLPRVRVAKPEVAAGADCLMRYRATKYSYGLQYTPTGNIYTAADSVNSSWTCTYDPLNRLTKAAGTSETVGWNYDSLSDRTAQTALVGTPPTSTLTFNASNNRADQLCYDTAGNVLDEVPCSQATVPSFAYDTDGKLISASNGIVKYIYDADGMRVAKQSNGSRTNEYLYDVAGNMAVEINGSASVIRQELYGGGRHLATVSGGGAGPFEYTHTNWLGTEAARSDSTGNLCFTAVSLPYGDGLTYSGNCNVSAKFFTGKERDAESGLDYFGARYYGSNMGRWMSPDWSATAEPVPYAKLDDPQSLNLYAYARNNPLSNVDTDGHEDVVADCKGKANCSVQVNQTVNLADNKGKVYSTISIQTNFTVTTDDKGNTSVSATSTASNVSGLKLTQGALEIIGSTNAAVQQAGATMGLGANTTQLLTAVAGQESKWGSAPPSPGEPARKDPFINPLQLSGGRGTLDFNQNVQGGLDVLEQAGRRYDYSPQPTYQKFSTEPSGVIKAFMRLYNGIGEQVAK